MDRRYFNLLMGIAGTAGLFALALIWQSQQTSSFQRIANADHGSAKTQVAAANWTTSALSAGKWVGMSEQNLLKEGEKYVEFNKSHVRQVNFQDFRGSAASCSPVGSPSGSGFAAYGGDVALRGVIRSGDRSFANMTNDCDRADGVWDSYCDPGIPGVPGTGGPVGCGLTCLKCDKGSCGPGGGCGLAGSCGSGCGIRPQGRLLGMMGNCGGGTFPAANVQAPMLASAGDCAGGTFPATGAPMTMDAPGDCAGGTFPAAGAPMMMSGPSECAGGTFPAASAPLLNGLGGCGSSCAGSGGCGAGGMLGAAGCGSECGCKRQITGVDSATCVKSGEPCWNMRGPIPWEMFAQGEYIGPPRLRHQDKYRLRVDDELLLVFRVTRNVTPNAYRLNVGDEIRIESVADEDLDRELVVQPDGTITARLIGQVMAAGRTTDEIRRDLEERYTKFYNEPAITVTPSKVNTKLEDLRATVDSRAGNGGQTFTVTIAPDGTIQLPGLGSVPAHGMTLEEVNMEVNARYAQLVPGIEVTAVLNQRAPRFIYIVGEVQQPGRVELVGPTTVIQAIAMAQGWVNGANLRNIVIFRRAEDWRLLATKVDIQGALYGTRPAPSDEIWLRDSDIVIVPKAPIKVLNDAIQLIFTNGIYAAAPFFSDPVIFTDASNL